VICGSRIWGAVRGSRQPRRAASMAAMSIFFIVIIASKARFASQGRQSGPEPRRSTPRWRAATSTCRIRRSRRESKPSSMSAAVSRTGSMTTRSTGDAGERRTQLDEVRWLTKNGAGHFCGIALRPVKNNRRPQSYHRSRFLQGLRPTGTDLPERRFGPVYEVTGVAGSI
jgi:hypothetical protein